jgi:hypothetical protein
VGHHGGRGTTAAAMVHRVLLIDMCLVLDLCVGMVLTYRRSTLPRETCPSAGIFRL